MTRRSSDSTTDSITVKIEESLLHPSTQLAASSSPFQEPHSMRSLGKRRRKSAVQYVGLDLELESESEYAPQQVKAERRSGEQEDAVLSKSKKRNKKAHIGHYQEVSRHFKKEFASLAEPKRIPEKILLESYKRSRDLNIFMIAEYDERQEEFIKMRDTRTGLNAKMKSLKTALADAKEAYKAAEIRASLHEKKFRDANLQLTLKLAQPLSHAQIKFENVQQDYAVEMAELRNKLVEAKNAKESAVRELAAVRAEIAQLPAWTDLRTPETIQELYDLQLEVAKMQKAKEEFEAFASMLTTNNLQLESKTQVLEAENADLKVKVEDTTKTATAVREAAQKEIEELKKTIQEQRLAFENTLRFFRPA